jgi:hypothetical protein
MILDTLGLLEGKKPRATPAMKLSEGCYPIRLHGRSGRKRHNSRRPGVACEFALEIVSLFASEEISEEIAKSMLLS